MKGPATKRHRIRKSLRFLVPPPESQTPAGALFTSQNSQPDRFPSGSLSENQRDARPAFFARRSVCDFSNMGYTLLPAQTGIPIPRPLLPVDRFPSFILIASPSVIATTLSEGAQFRERHPSTYELLVVN